MAPTAFRAEVATKTEGFRSELATAAVPEADAQAKQGGHGGLIRDFINCLQTGKTPETIAADNIKSLAMVFAAIESAETHQRVLVNL